MSVIMYLISIGIIKIMNLKNVIIYLVLNLFIQFLMHILILAIILIKTVNLQLLKLF